MGHAAAQASCVECVPDSISKNNEGLFLGFCGVPCVLGKRELGADDCTKCSDISGTAYNDTMTRDADDPSTWTEPRCRDCPLCRVRFPA